SGFPGRPAGLSRKLARDYVAQGNTEEGFRRVVEPPAAGTMCLSTEEEERNGGCVYQRHPERSGSRGRTAQNHGHPGQRDRDRRGTRRFSVSLRRLDQQTLLRRHPQPHRIPGRRRGGAQERLIILLRSAALIVGLALATPESVASLTAPESMATRLS